MQDTTPLPRIDWPRLIAAGLLAGLVINISGICLAHFVLGDEYIRTFQDRMPAESRARMAVMHLGMRFGWGLMGMFICVGFGPRFGRGAPAALLAGLMLWLTTGILAAASLHMQGILTGWRLWTVLPWSLAEDCVAVWIGSLLYQDLQPRPDRPAA